MYKPRAGKINANLDKYTKEMLDKFYEEGKDLLQKFGYEESFTGVPMEDPQKFIREFNAQSLEKAIYNANEAEEVTSIVINDEAIQLRSRYNNLHG
mmetsp:Transcript_13128/g.12965  ORF Transcript_13128/g.12965 Transcript_13128/m.12965 type:complete len:96 (+) Transcript_13128:755-1042(+)|eukprot:CAMPEP_0170540446 /NCGR_PEP_ID=MMETSP0211-20121228/446_1 /TAXON_ID=311385 /ORGANISM="Pseudokeronopsis sp., Strain OXSARD2" /LENGTH=95 /DNA_ID=CAMNT_0010842863 /DNA_START=755 /DNA_END=1042 /DNA_ORIENTATION=-